MRCRSDQISQRSCEKTVSYTNSLSFGDVADFEWRVTVVAGTEDEVIPEQVIGFYMKPAAIRPCRSHKLIRLDGAGNILHPLAQEPSARSRTPSERV